VLSIDDALARPRQHAAAGERRLIGICGPPGGGKSTLAERLADDVGERARLVSQAELVRLGREDRIRCCPVSRRSRRSRLCPADCA
jgi:pantothenate kinase-related protein Tda10